MFSCPSFPTEIPGMSKQNGPIGIPKDAIETYLRLDQARAARDGLARMLYGRS